MTDDIPTDDGNGLDLDTFYNILSSFRRRSVIKHLSEHGSLDKGELATLVAADEVGKDPNELVGDERKRVLVSLQQAHLDTLEENGIIERERDIIKQGEHFGEMISGLQIRGESQSGILDGNGDGQTINLTIENATINIDADLESDDL